jgi:hypothetical protein
LEKQFYGLRLEMNRMICLLERDNLAGQQDKPGIFGPARSLDEVAVGSDTHHVEASAAERAPGVVFTTTIDPGHGTSHVRHHSEPFSDSRRPTPGGFRAESGHVSLGRLPKLQFPVFSGDDPQLWKSRCESYFSMFGVEEILWIQVAGMHFEGAVAHWWQSVERCLESASWPELCRLLHERFGHDQHEALIRQLFHIRQVGSVADYVEHFSALVDQLAAYETVDNLLYYAMRFIDGLRDDIKPMVMIQRPVTLDSACDLVLVQEALDSSKKVSNRCYEPSFSRTARKSVYPSLMPHAIDK